MNHSIRMLTLFLCTLSVGCAFFKKMDRSPEETMAWLDLAPGSVEICLSGFEDGPRLRDGRTTLPVVRRHLVEEKPVEAMELMAELDDHPQVEVHRAATDLMQRQLEPAWQRVRSLLETYPQDPCLLQLAGITRLLQGDVDGAKGYAAEAVELSGGHPELIFFQAIVYSRAGQMDESAGTLRSTLAADPDHEGAAALLAMIYLEQGDGELAVPLLEVAFEGGMAVSALLAPAYYDAGLLDDYIRVASRSGWPLGDQGRLADAESPMDALAAHLGVGPMGGLVAELETSQGTLSCDLFWKQSPLTVANFVGLARGGLEWTHPVSGAVSQEPLYTGTRLHRVIPQFMIQGGDPIGEGTGGPGYSFPDEIHPDHRFDGPGLLAMANSGPATNGSQFFITEVPTPHLNGRHTIFGQCDEAAIGVIKTITAVERDASDRPVEDVILKEIRIKGR